MVKNLQPVWLFLFRSQIKCCISSNILPLYPLIILFLSNKSQQLTILAPSVPWQQTWCCMEYNCVYSNIYSGYKSTIWLHKVRKTHYASVLAQARVALSIRDPWEIEFDLDQEFCWFSSLLTSEFYCFRHFWNHLYLRVFID